ncbi:fatty acid desaturase family protein [Caulobacter sp. 17J65-9]|uniref:fatty acid desaturase family protein n=1 Tax=Caulobacter sp. 17J65-9 TaxID=2709382 RepID=UPI0013CA797A|nr:fatty acid desaturase family protein [Caulobacter sp. 17J65-9]NEX92113.1 fatty acid desaturase family protein [Caulobacter sp. 17J65-9]
MPAAARVQPKDFFTPEEWGPLTRRSSWKGLALVAHAWGVIGLAIAAAVVWPVLIPLSVMIVGTRQLGLAILMHEAAHGGLHPNARVNDFVGHWLCAVPIGASLASYRPYHLSHHKYAQQAEDPDLPLSAPFPVTRASLRRKIVRDLTGQTYFKQRVAPFFRRRQPDAPEGANVTVRSVAPFFLVNGLMLLGFGLSGLWWAWFVLWLLPMATWFPMVTRLRNIAEHACTPALDDPLRHARTTRANLVERALIAPYWVNFHCEHHMFMYLPCWSLPEAHRLLGAKGVWPRMETAPGYLAVLKTASARPA